jgi:hypothetical protein
LNTTTGYDDTFGSKDNQKVLTDSMIGLNHFRQNQNDLQSINNDDNNATTDGNNTDTEEEEDKESKMKLSEEEALRISKFLKSDSNNKNDDLSVESDNWSNDFTWNNNIIETNDIVSLKNSASASLVPLAGFNFIF